MENITEWIMERARACGKTLWTNLFIVVNIVRPDIFENLKNKMMEYIGKTGDFSVDGFLNYLRKNDDEEN